MKRAFTLMEVNLAIMIMAGGILSILGLYSLGYRENSQSREDVAATAKAPVAVSWKPMSGRAPMTRALPKKSAAPVIQLWELPASTVGPARTR